MKISSLFFAVVTAQEANNTQPVASSKVETSTEPIAAPVEDPVTEPIAVPFGVPEVKSDQNIDCSTTPNPAACEQLNNLNQGQLPDLNTEQPGQNLPELETFSGNRCPKNVWNTGIATPQPSSGAYCPQYECSSCCNDEKFIQELGPKGNADSTFQYGPFHFEGCNGSKKTSGGQMGSKCHDFVKTAHCVQSCDPNSYVFYPSDATRGATQIPVCDSFCQDFFNACKDEYMCYSKDGITEILADISNETFDPEKKDYKIFKCEGEYTCEKLEDTPFAGNGILYELDPVIREALKTAFKKWADKYGIERMPAHQTFCQRFSTNLYNPVVQENRQCYDPRSPSDLEQAVHDHQEDYNKNPDNKDKLSFPATPECSTGLSGWAIFGIVIGSVAGALLIGVAIYFLACNKKDDKGNYEVTKQNEPDVSVPMQGDIVKGTSIKSTNQSVKSNHDYDPNESRTD